VLNYCLRTYERRTCSCSVKTYSASYRSLNIRSFIVEAAVGLDRQAVLERIAEDLCGSSHS
jgi:hypothetical protein